MPIGGGHQVRATILVVDDDAGILESFEAVLSKDYDVLFAAQGPDALRILSTREVNLVLLDGDLAFQFGNRGRRRGQRPLRARRLQPRCRTALQALLKNPPASLERLHAALRDLQPKIQFQQLEVSLGHAAHQRQQQIEPRTGVRRDEQRDAVRGRSHRRRQFARARFLSSLLIAGLAAIALPQPAPAGTLTVQKVVTGSLSPQPTATFTLKVDCAGFPSNALNLTNGGTLTLPAKPPGTVCTVREPTLPPPFQAAGKTCTWHHVPATQTVPINGPSQIVVVNNSYTCV